MNIEYLLFNFLILFFSSLGVVIYPGALLPRLRPALTAILGVGLLYLIWDYFVTDWWWKFNAEFVLGVFVGRLPLEEILFFLTVPWSCLIIWVNLKSKISSKPFFRLENILLLFSVPVGVWATIYNKWYSALTALVILIVVLISKLSHHWLNSKSALVFLSMVFLLTIIFNGYLTARPVVIYNSDVISNIKIYTIPIEDLFYGLTLISASVILYEKLSEKRKS